MKDVLSGVPELVVEVMSPLEMYDQTKFDSDARSSGPQECGQRSRRENLRGYL